MRALYRTLFFVVISSDFHGFICSVHTLWLLKCDCRIEIMRINLPLPNYNKTQQIANRLRDSCDIPLSTLYVSIGTFVKCWTSTNTDHDWCFSCNNWQNSHYWRSTLSDINEWNEILGFWPRLYLMRTNRIGYFTDGMDKIDRYQMTTKHKESANCLIA